MKETLAALQPCWMPEGSPCAHPGRHARHGRAQLRHVAGRPRAELCALDRDEEALELARRRLEPFGGRVHTYHCRYSQFEEALDDLGWDRVDAVLLDIGVSSLQLDEAERGFSFYGDGPLDMRMDQHSGAPSAWHWVNRENFDRLKECIATLGEEPQAGRIARAIVDARQKSPHRYHRPAGGPGGEGLPARLARQRPAAIPPRAFQALRMAVNDELGELRRFLDAILGPPVPGRSSDGHFLPFPGGPHGQAGHAPLGRGLRCPRHVPVCVCHHVPEVEILYKKPVQADEDELAVNPRASSAKLRAVEKIAEAVS